MIIVSKPMNQRGSHTDLFPTLLGREREIYPYISQVVISVHLNPQRVDIKWQRLPEHCSESRCLLQLGENIPGHEPYPGIEQAPRISVDGLPVYVLSRYMDIRLEGGERTVAWDADMDVLWDWGYTVREVLTAVARLALWQARRMPMNWECDAEKEQNFAAAIGLVVPPRYAPPQFVPGGQKRDNKTGDHRLAAAGDAP